MASELAALVLQALPGAVLAVDLEDRVTAWNAAAERLFGWRADEVIGRPLPTVPADAHERRRRWIERSMAGEEVEVTTQQLHRDGRRIDVLLRYAPIRSEGGEIIGSVVMCRDASSQLRAAARLQRSQAELALVRRLANLVHRMLRDLDLAAVLNAIVEVAVDLVDAGSGVLSLERSDAPGTFVRIANVNIPEDLVDHVITPGVGLHGKVLVTGQPFSVSDYDRWSGGMDSFQGRGFHASLAVPIHHDDGVIGALSVHSIVPRRRFGPSEIDVLTLLAEYASIAITNATSYRQVSAERERFHRLVDAMPAGLAVVEGGVVTGWNTAAELLTGRRAAEVIGGPPPIDLDAAAGGVELTSGGRTRWVEAVRSDLPATAGHLYLLRDLTEQRDLERAKDLFFATTSHELKTPLTVVHGLASTLLRHWDRMPEDRRVEALQTIERRAESLDRLIERILVGSRVQAGAFEVTPTPVDLRRLIEEIVPGFAAAASPAHSVVFSLPPAVPLVAAERQALDTILGHLLENAIKYSPGGGMVRVTVEVPGRGAPVVVSVSDEGVGIDVTDIERLVAPFVQADGRTTRRFGGVGLGLYIVRSLVDALGGELSVTNVDGGGSRFSFTVPLWV